MLTFLSLAAFFYFVLRIFLLFIWQIIQEHIDAKIAIESALNTTAVVNDEGDLNQLINQRNQINQINQRNLMINNCLLAMEKSVVNQDLGGFKKAHREYYNIKNSCPNLNLDKNAKFISIQNKASMVFSCCICPEFVAHFDYTINLVICYNCERMEKSTDIFNICSCSEFIGSGDFFHDREMCYNCDGYAIKK